MFVFCLTSPGRSRLLKHTIKETHVAHLPVRCWVSVQFKLIRFSIYQSGVLCSSGCSMPTSPNLALECLRLIVEQSSRDWAREMSWKINWRKNRGAGCGTFSLQFFLQASGRSLPSCIIDYLVSKYPFDEDITGLQGWLQEWWPLLPVAPHSQLTRKNA